MNNQEQIFIHLNLKDDLAYQTAVKNESLQDMQLVLRAYGEKHDWESASDQITLAWDILKKGMTEDELAEREGLEWERTLEFQSA